MPKLNIIEKYELFQQKFNQRKKIRITLDAQFDSKLDIMQYVILSKFEKNAKNIYKQKNNKLCDKIFKQGFNQLTDQQRLYYYTMIVSHLQRIIHQDLNPPKKSIGSIKCNGYSKTYSKIGWKQVNLKLDLDKSYLYIEKNNKMKALDLNLYILRKSKATEYYSLVLEAINQLVNQSVHKVHIGFRSTEAFDQWYQNISSLIQFLFWEKIKKIVFPSDIIEILQKKSLHENMTSQTSVYMSSKLTKSQFVSSQKKIGQKKQVGLDLTRSLMHLPDQKSNKNVLKKQQVTESLHNSVNSIEIKSQVQDNQVNVTLQQSQYMGKQDPQNETYRSFAMLGIDDIENDQKQDQLALFNKLIGDCDLSKFGQLKLTYKQAYASQNRDLIIYSDSQNKKNMHVCLAIQPNQTHISAQYVSLLFSSPSYLKVLNQQIQQITTRTILTIDNSAILYQKNKNYNRLYRSRDFVFIRHQFILNGKYYIVDKSIQDLNIPPFTTIVRGQIINIIQIKSQTKSQFKTQIKSQKLQYTNESHKRKQIIKINIQSKLQNFGYLQEFQQLNINIKYLRGFQNMTDRLRTIPKDIVPLLKSSWRTRQSKQYSNKEYVIKPTLKVNQNYVNQKKVDQSKQSLMIDEAKQSQSKRSTQNDILDSTTNNTQNKQKAQLSLQKMQLQGQISETQPQTIKQQTKLIRKFDSQGKILINYGAINRKQQTQPYPLDKKTFKHQTGPDGAHPIWKGNWEFLKQGGFKFVNAKQIQDQKGVLKFIFSQVARNVVTGKSILNISLPVDIFSSQSNLQRFVYAMCYGPMLLQSRYGHNELDRFLHSTIFGLTQSPMYLQMLKPFNPILGQTFQCYINGCPAYAQQISHHPPIAAIMLYGRGYRVTAQIQSKMKLNINSGTGLNQGVYRIDFQNGEQVCYTCPGGEVQGLAYGDRKFNFIGKAYVWCQKTSYFLEIIFNPKKGFFGKQQNPIDYIEGHLLIVKPEFLQQFMRTKSGSPKKAQIISDLGKFHGKWNEKLYFQDRLLFNYDQQLPLQLEYEEYPLASDANWRQDIGYRRLLQITTAQIWKEKLQIQQRDQRKLRQKYHKNDKK